MIALDRFFDSYERLVPCWLSDLLVPAVIVGTLLLVLF
jgi:hypothetical protein